MADIYDKKKRSWIMSRIRSEGSRMERAFEAEIRRADLKYESHPKHIVGKPDFVIRDCKVAVFCDSEFWHGYRMGPRAMSKLTPFWRKKISANKSRDKKVDRLLREDGWKVLRFWGREIDRNPSNCVREVLDVVK